MQDNINEIISNALSVNKVDLKQNLKQVITQLKKTFESNKDVILQTNAIDKKNNNGFIIDFKENPRHYLYPLGSKKKKQKN